MGLIYVIGLLQARHGYVTRRLLAEELGMTENSFAPKINYLLQLGLVSSTQVRAQNHIGFENHIKIDSRFAELLAYWIGEEQQVERSSE
jgi:predicted transcriptional regulator